MTDEAVDVKACVTEHRIAGLEKALQHANAKIDKLETALHLIAQWGDAYPLAVFPEPDLAKARTLLEAGGMTLDRVSASNMRYVAQGIAKIAAEALR